MNEEMIINGVNVAGCGYFNETDKECNICGMGTSGEDTFCRDCKDNSNCYYKQLKRLEQENERLKKSIEYSSVYNDMQAEIDYGEKLIEKYRKALEEIREIVKSNEWIYQDLLPTHIYKNTMQIQAKISEVLK